MLHGEETARTDAIQVQ